MFQLLERQICVNLYQDDVHNKHSLLPVSEARAYTCARNEGAKKRLTRFSDLVSLWIIFFLISPKESFGLIN
jgi:hypothetical protein